MGLWLARVSWLATVAATVTAASAHAAGAQSPKLEPGVFLVAARGLADRHFAESVVLLFAYSARDGAAGLILTRPAASPVRSAVPDLPIPRAADPRVFFGGPVAPAEPRALWRSGTASAAFPRLLPDVTFLGSLEAIDAAIANGATAQNLRVYAGYAGWSPNQLERELARGDWHVRPGESAIVFSTEPLSLWQRLIRMTDVLRL
jgi:putative transcriptional regulator